MDISNIILPGKGRLQQLELNDKFKSSLNRDCYGYKNAFTKLKIICLSHILVEKSHFLKNTQANNHDLQK